MGGVLVEADGGRESLRLFEWARYSDSAIDRYGGLRNAYLFALVLREIATPTGRAAYVVRSLLPRGARAPLALRLASSVVLALAARAVARRRDHQPDVYWTASSPALDGSAGGPAVSRHGVEIRRWDRWSWRRYPATSEG
jgi:hypothetical protein